MGQSEKEQARQRIEEFIRQRRYTYSVESLLTTFVEYYQKGYYISHTAEDCIKHLEKDLEILAQS